MEMNRTNLQLIYNEVDHNLRLTLFGKPILGSNLVGRIGKDLAVIKTVELHEGSDSLGHHTRWTITFVSEEDDQKHFTGIIQVYESHIVFNTKYPKALYAKKGKHLFGHPYISFPSFEGTTWETGLSMLSYKRQAPFNYPLQWKGHITESLRDGKHVPLLATTPDYETIVLSPLNHLLFNSVTLSPFPKAIRCGLPRALHKIPSGTTVKTLLVFQRGVNRTLKKWGELLRSYHHTDPILPNHDILLSKISYWTNAGSAYWYQSYKKGSYQDTLTALKEHHDKIGLHFGSYQLDSWWYRRENESYTAGIIEWEPRLTVPVKNYNSVLPSIKRARTMKLFQENRLSHIQDLLQIPIGCHFKQLSKDTPYILHSPKDFLMEPFPMPKNKKAAKQLFLSIFSHPKWRLSYIIHDWLQWMNDHHPVFRHFKQGPAYFKALDSVLREISAADNTCGHLTLQLCMTQPHMTLFSVTMPSVTTIRSTADSNSFFIEGTKRWWWHLYSSAFIQALGKYAFFDNRFSYKSYLHPLSSYSRFEFIWLALSCGPIGIGDPIGRENMDLINQVIMEDGRILKPDEPANPFDYCYLSNPHSTNSRKGVTVYTHTTYSGVHPDQLYYLLSFNLHPLAKKVTASITLSDLELDCDKKYVLYDFFSENYVLLTGGESFQMRLQRRRFYYHLLAEVHDGLTFLGDTSKYVSASPLIIRQVEYEQNRIIINGHFSRNTSPKWVVYSERPLFDLFLQGIDLSFHRKGSIYRIEPQGPIPTAQVDYRLVLVFA